MKKVIILIVMLLFICAPKITMADGNFDQHFTLSLLFGAIGETLVHSRDTFNAPTKILAGLVIGSVPGLIKEISDGNESDNHFSEDQMLYDVMGSTVGSFIAYKYNSRTKVKVSGRDGGALFSLSYRY